MGHIPKPHILSLSEMSQSATCSSFCFFHISKIFDNEYPFSGWKSQFERSKGNLQLHWMWKARLMSVDTLEKRHSSCWHLHPSLMNVKPSWVVGERAGLVLWGWDTLPSWPLVIFLASLGFLLEVSCLKAYHLWLAHSALVGTVWFQLNSANTECHLWFSDLLH
jgi:hypothetical protein